MESDNTEKNKHLSVTLIPDVHTGNKDRLPREPDFYILNSVQICCENGRTV